MKKIQDIVLEERISNIIESSTDPANEIVELLRKFQDAGGLKICQPKQEEVL